MPTCKADGIDQTQAEREGQDLGNGTRRTGKSLVQLELAWIIQKAATPALMIAAQLRETSFCNTELLIWQWK